ncbi:MAG: acyltransferase [Pseudomonadota bacterium]
MKRAFAALRRVYLRRVWGMQIGEGTSISGKAFLDFTNPRGVHIGAWTVITPGVRIFTHDYIHAAHCDTHIGSKCFIGANSVITAGVTVGDHCIIAAGSIVTKDVPARSMVAGNPAKVIKQDLRTGQFGRVVPWAKGLN